MNAKQKKLLKELFDAIDALEIGPCDSQALQAVRAAADALRGGKK